MRIGGVCAVALGLAALASCGGGDADSEPCTSSSFGITTSWTVSGGAYNPQPYLDQIVVGRVGVPLSAKPVHTGIPAGCIGKGVYSLGNASFPLPPGLALNASTGEISGTATAAGDVSGGGTDTGIVRLAFPGFQSTRVLARLLVQQ